ncbi:NAD(P)-binding domain [Lasallia pustulata]|uniref:NAD(P)-binding domain n=1 Tax=Lasallia pustulata TaxID=136370 RepID=A0A1W5DDQ6_9LECA|nr:NAD(P)-binding domain [Lasallia pustulata]
MSSKKKIVVAGGNGFLGSRICKSAVSRGWDVVSISRSGEPVWSSVTSSPNPPPWSKSVSWQKADLLKPTTYKPILKDADAVVHTMGILLEADYKGVITGKESIWGGLSRAFSATKRGSQNPLERKEGEALEPQEKDGQLTYELMNRDSAITLAQESAFEKVSTFVFISAAAGAPMLPSRYITTKREAESTIASSLPKLRSIFIRPGFLYDSSRAFTMPIAFFGGAGHMVNSALGGRLTWLAGAAVEKPLKADLVAEAVVEAIGDESTNGVVGTGEIEALANKAWRRAML